MVVVGLDGLVYLLLFYIGERTQLAHRGTALVLLLELGYLVLDFRQRANLVEGQAHDAALLGDGLQDALTNPPHGV